LEVCVLFAEVMGPWAFTPENSKIFEALLPPGSVNESSSTQ
jgi:hypothetical protein